MADTEKMGVLYDVSISAINQHLKKIFNDGELVEEPVIKRRVKEIICGELWR